MVSQTMINSLRKVLNMMIQKSYNEVVDQLEEEMEETREAIKNYVLRHLIDRKATILDTITNDDGTVTVTIIPLDANSYRKYQELLDKYDELKLRYQELLEKLEIWHGLALANKDNLVEPPELPDELKVFLERAEALLED